MHGRPSSGKVQVRVFYAVAFLRSVSRFRSSRSPSSDVRDVSVESECKTQRRRSNSTTHEKSKSDESLKPIQRTRHPAIWG